MYMCIKINNIYPFMHILVHFIYKYVFIYTFVFNIYICYMIK